MSDSVQMPALGESVTEGTVTRWLKQVGEQVEVDEPLLEVSTDKVDTEIPSPVAGVLEEILVGEDETVEVGADLARIGDGSAAGKDSDDAEQSDDAGQSDDAQQADGADEQAGREEATQDTAGSELQEEQAEANAGAVEDGDGESEGSQSGAPQSDGGAGGSPSGGSAGGTPVTMPALGESVTEGTVTRWLKQEGDSVEVDEPLLEVSTDKVDTEIPSPVAGVISKILVAEDETVEVGAELAIVGGDAGGDGDDVSGAQGQQAADEQPAGDAEEPAGEEQPSSDEDVAEGDLAAEKQEQERAAAQAEDKNQPGRDSDAPSSDAPSSDAPSSGQPAQRRADDTSAGQDRPRAQQPPADSASYVTPLVRKLAAEHDVDLSAVTGTGVGGRIRKQDVLDAAKASQAAKAEEEKKKAAEPAAASAPRSGGGDLPAGVAAKRGTTEKMSRLRKVIAQRMVESLQVAAQLTTVVEVDVTRIARLRDRAKRDFEAREGVKLSFLPFFAKAAVEALGQHPKVNASLDGDQIVYHAQENLGVAVDTEKGLLVPVVRDAGDLSLAGLSRKIADLAARTRTNKIGPDELGGGTFTLTNTGSRGALFDTPIINQPQVAILGTGSVVKRPVVMQDADGGETLAIRSMVYLALSYDHRLVDGADAARFLVTVKTRLEEGAFEGDVGL